MKKVIFNWVSKLKIYIIYLLYVHYGSYKDLQCYLK